MSIDNFDNPAAKEKGFSDDGFGEAMYKEFKCYNVCWDVDDSSDDLPNEITIFLSTDGMSIEEINEEIVENLTEYTGFCVLSYECDDLESYANI